MRVDVRKFLFIGTEDIKEAFFKKAQELGIINFIDTRIKPGPKEVPPEIHRITAAIKVLRHFPPVEQEENLEEVKSNKIVNEILSLHEENEKILEQMRVLDIEMARIDMFGEFALEDIAYIEKEAKCKIQFFAARPGLFQDSLEPEGLVFIGSEHNLDYYIAINPHQISYDKMIEIKIEHSLGTLKKKYKEAEQKQREIEHQLKEYAKFNQFLHHFLIHSLNKVNLEIAQNYIQVAMEGFVFAIEGWVPQNKIPTLNSLTEGLNVHVEEIAIEPTDFVPTYLENQGLDRIGEDLTNIYDTPSNTDADPSLWVLGSFALFFAFIVGDAGYGLIYLALAFYLRYKFPNLEGTSKRVLKLFTILSISCVLWGLLMTSFFGIQIAPDNPLRKISLLHWLAEKKAIYHYQHYDETYQEWIGKYPEIAKIHDPERIMTYSPHEGAEPREYPILNTLNDNVLFELALFIGVLHIILSLTRYLRKNWHGAGWIAFLVGAYLYFASYLQAPSILNYVGGIDLIKGGEFGLMLMLGGIIFAVIVSIIRHGFTGIFELMTVIQVFADILSYLRLYALSLAGAIVSGTISEVAGVLPLAAAIVVMIIAHFINLVLNTMSGVIHGLRLNFIEWYHYSFEGGGKQFRPLKLLKIE